MVLPPSGAKATHILQALRIERPEALIIIFGAAAGFDETMKPRVETLFARGIARAAIQMSAMIMDGGTEAGVMAVMGQAVAAQGRKSILLGVAPAGKVTYPRGPEKGSIEDSAPLDPNHSHFVLVEGDEWGDETETLYRLAEELVRGTPVLTILADGGRVARKEVLLTIRRDWPLIVIEGTGRLANQIAATIRGGTTHSDQGIGSIVRGGRIELFHIDEGPDALTNLIVRELSREVRD